MNHSMFDLNKLSDHYSKSYKKYGFNSRGADWGDFEKHNLRITSMIELLGDDAFKNRSVLDVGCGYGSLYSAIKNYYPAINLRYVGIDPCAEVINYAKSTSDSTAEFICTDIQSFSTSISFDTVFCCGIFTKKAIMSDDEMYELLIRFFDLLKKLNPSSVCFNTMSAFCNRFDDDIFYPNYERIMGMISSCFGYRVSDFVLSNSHLRYEMIWKFSID